MGFTFNGVHTDTLNINVNRENINALSSQRNNLQVIDGKDGLYDFGSFFEERYINFECNVLPYTSYQELLLAIDNINKHFNPKNGSKELIIDELSTRKYYARLHNALDVERIVRTAGRFDLNFVCTDPYAYENGLVTQTFSTNAIHNFNVGGSASVYPVLRIRGDISLNDDNLKLTFNDSDSDVIEIRGTIDNGHELIIDCKDMTIEYKNRTTEEVVNGFIYIDTMSFPELLNGDNTLKIEGVDSLSNPLIYTMNVEYFRRWL